MKQECLPEFLPLISNINQATSPAFENQKVTVSYEKIFKKAVLLPVAGEKVAGRMGKSILKF